MDRLHIFKHEDLYWPFDGKVRLSYYKDDAHIYEEVDPFPCYTHDLKLVESEIKEIEEKLPLPFPPKYFIMPYEGISRTNGWATSNQQYDGKDEKGEDKKTLKPYIVIAGKRIPIIPAMTRYLIAHEYGHIVHGNVAHKMGIDYDEFKDYYAKEIRNITVNKDYGALKWHTNTGEIIANDIRITLLNKEVDFWPHEVSHPFEVKDQMEKLKELVKKYL